MGVEWKTSLRGNLPELGLDTTEWRSLSKRFGEKTELLLTCTWLLCQEIVILGFKRKCTFLPIGGLTAS